jgi:2-polyprenyl-3-methyl-5-hydroxy-6-metoxy-1,4-benzoquinol methylase
VMTVKRIFNHVRWRLSLLLKVLNPSKRRHDEDSVKFQRLMAANNEQVFEQMYSDPKLLQHYLVSSRLDFYREVARKVADIFEGEIAKAACVDVGCGTGHLIVELRNLGFAGRLVGLDSAVAAGEQVRAHGVGLEFYPGYLASQAWQHEFDLVLCTEVLEHCDHPSEIVLDMFRVVKPGGQIVITVPDGRKDTWEGHVHFWSPESFKLFINEFQKKAKFDYFDNTNFCVIYC